MLFTEPERTRGDIHFPLFGIPVRIHPLFWLVAVLLGLSPSTRTEPVALLIWVAAVSISILIHELGHAVAMRLFGLRSRIVLYGMGGLTIPETAGGRRAMRPPAQVLISLAGPLAGFALAGGLAAVIVLTGHGKHLFVAEVLSIRILPLVGGLSSPILQALLNYLFVVSVFWGLMNLLPVYPLDGGQVAQEVFRAANPHDGIRQSLMLSVFTAMLVVVVAIVRWQEFYLALLFGYLAYSSYSALTCFGGRRW